MDIQRLVITESAGSKSALVFDPITPKQRQHVVDLIQHDLPDIEQVMFVKKDGDRWHGQMIGKGYCGNAARSLGYVATCTTQTAQPFTVSGLTRYATVEAGTNSAKLKMFTAMRIETKILLGDLIEVVHFEGISHAILTPKHNEYKALLNYTKIHNCDPGHNPEMMAVLDELELTNQPTSSLVFVTQDNGILDIVPYTFIRDTNKLFRMASCTTGSVAAAIRSNIGNGVSVRQPSGKALRIMWSQRNMGLMAMVDGDMFIKWDGRITGIGRGIKERRNDDVLLTRAATSHHARFT